jgi:phosphate transport system permease protein
VFGFSGFAAALAISISMLPIITRTSEEVLRLVPDGLREASLAMGGSEWRTTWSVVLPTARTGLITAVILGIARAVGETAPLIATAFGSSVMNTNPFSGPQAALPLYIYKLVTESSSPNVQARAFAGAFVLMAMVLILFTIARLIGWSASRSFGRRVTPSTFGATDNREGLK